MIRIILYRLLHLTSQTSPNIEEILVSIKRIFVDILQRIAHHSDESLSQRGSVRRIESLLGLQHLHHSVSLDFLNDFAQIVDSIAEQRREKAQKHLLALLQNQMRRQGRTESDRQPRHDQQNVLADGLRSAFLLISRPGNAHIREHGQDVDDRGEIGLDGLLGKRGHDLHEEFQTVEARGTSGAESLEEKEERFGLVGSEHGGESQQEDVEEEDESRLVGSLLPGILAEHDGEKPGVGFAGRVARIDDLNV